MLTGAWAAAFANGQLTIQAGTLSSATGVLKLDPNQEILLDGNNSGNFVDTGANMATITGTIQIDANTSVNSNFIIDNHAGAFFEAPASFPAGTPLFNYTGSTALRPNDSLTVRGVGGVAESFEVALDATSNVIANNTTTGESGTVVLTEPPTPLNQQNQLTVTFGPNLATSPNSTGITGHLTLDGVNANGANQLFIDDQGATINPIAAGLPTKPGTASDWTLNGTSIAGPQFPPAPTVPPTTNPPPGLVGNITYANIANLQFNDNVAGDLLTINSVATNTTASDLVANYTVVNYNQPLAFPVNIQGVQGTAGGTLDIVGAVNGNNDFYVDDHSVALAATGTKPQYNTPFTHLGADLTYTLDSLSAMNVAGNGGDNIVTVQVPPTLNPPFPSDTLPAAFTVYGGALPPPPVLKGAKPVLVTPRTNFLRVFGNAPGPLTTGADSITVNDLAGGAAAGGNVILMSQITGVVLYGEGGDDTLTNSSVGNVKTGLSPVPALFIPGDGNATLTGGGGSDMFLGGNGQYTISSKAVSTPAKTTTNYYFPHQDQFGNIYDPLLNPNVGNTTSMLTGAGGNEVVVTGSVDPSISVAVDPITGTTVGDLDTGNLANPGVGGKPGGGGVTAATGGTLLSYSTVPPTNVTAPLYMVTDALSALEQAMGIARGPFPANVPAELEFGGSLNLRAQFASPAAFVGRAYNDFLVDRAGAGGTFGAAQTNGGSTSAGPEGGAVVSQAEIDNAANLIQNHQLTVQSLQADLLASDELRQLLPGPSQWVRSLYEAVTGSPPTDQQFTADVNMLTGGDTTAARFNLALALLNSPEGQAIEIQDAYTNVVPGASALTPKAPSPTDLVAIQADLASGESLPQVAQIMGASSGNYLSYEEANDVGTVGYVANVYQSVLHRPASTIDLLFWAGQRGVGVSNASIAFTVLSSPEAKMYVVINAYERYLGRDPDASGLAFWQAQLTSGLSDEGFISLIVSSPEYYAKYGNTSAGYVTGLYHDLLQRGTTQQEIDYWVTQLAASPRGAVQARADIALGFMQSPEYQTLLIDAWYQQFDGRAPTEAELVAALQTFNTGAGDEQVAAQILAARARS